MHDDLCHVLVDVVVVPVQIFDQALTGCRELQNHNVLIWLFVPVQKLDDLGNPGAFVGENLQTDLQRNGFRIILLEERQFL